MYLALQMTGCSIRGACVRVGSGQLWQMKVELHSLYVYAGQT